MPDFGYTGKHGKLYTIIKPKSIDKNGKAWNARNEVTQYLPFDDRLTGTPDFDKDVPY